MDEKLMKHFLLGGTSHGCDPRTSGPPWLSTKARLDILLSSGGGWDPRHGVPEVVSPVGCGHEVDIAGHRLGAEVPRLLQALVAHGSARLQT